MKAKFLWASLLLFAGITACTDDAIETQTGNSSKGEGTPAYLTISFTSNGVSSTRATSNNGDTHGDAEDSGHKNTGTEKERTVNQALVVVAPADGGNVGFAKLYTTTKTAQGTAPADDEFTIVDQTSGSFVNNTPIEVAVGRYNVLVVANPVSSLTTGFGDLAGGVTDINTVENLYNLIVTGAYAPSDTDYGKIADGSILTPAASESIQGIMMANKALNESGGAYSVELKENNDVDNPAPVSIEVERVYSKVTFRETTIENNPANVYPVEVNTGTVKARVVEAAIADESQTGQGTTYKKATLNVAHDADSPANTVYVLYEAASADAMPTFKAVYKETKQTSTQEDETKGLNIYEKLNAKKMSEWQSGDEDSHYCIKDADESTPEKSLTLLSDEESVPTTWYVRLEGYALVNLSKSVHYVRQITDAQGHDAFGKLNGANYLYTPFWEDKNGIDLSVDAPDFSGASDWFYNTLAEVSTESEELTFDAQGALKKNGADPKYFKSFSTLQEETTTNSGGAHGSVSSVGKRMAYLFENSTDVDHQVHGLSTGIAFVARIYSSYTNETTNTPIGKLYYFADHIYESLQAILNAYGEGYFSTDFKALVEKEKAGTEITQSDLAKLAEGGHEEVILYNGNVCYYYTTEIKHFDNGMPNELGNMEYAIMRNNIYSLAVTSINEIGKPIVDPTPDTPNESTKAALNVEAKILPWTVRYNDIEF